MPEKIPADRNIPIFITKRLDIVDNLFEKKPYLILMPNYDKWNYYNRRYFARLHIVGEDEDIIEMHLRIMFEGYVSSADALDELIAKYGDGFEIGSIKIPFVSLIPEEDNYRELMRILDFDNGISALRKLHDAIVLRTEMVDTNLVELSYSEEFFIGILRFTGSHTAIRRGERYFRRELPEVVHDSAGSFTFYTKLKSVDNELEINFDFSNKGVFRDRIAVLIGRNGVGKTKLLKAGNCRWHN